MITEFKEELAAAIKSILWTIRRTVGCLIEDEGTRIAAEASFYLVFSIFPLIFIIVLLIGFLAPSFSGAETAGPVTQILSTLVPDFTFEMLTKYLGNMIKQYNKTDLIVVLFVFAWPASNVFYAYLDAARRAYGIKSARNYIRARLLSFVLLLLSGTYIFISFIFIAFTPVFLRWLQTHAPLPESVIGISYIRYLGAFLLLTPSIGLIYRYGPDSENRSDLIIWPGAFTATVLWILFTQLFGVYLKYFATYRALYGALGTALLLVLWMYLTSIAVIIGAEFNYVLMGETSPDSNTTANKSSE